jgi:hypothetical protein
MIEIKRIEHIYIYIGLKKTLFSERIEHICILDLKKTLFSEKYILWV